ncbi:MAG: peptide chain release factor 1 [Erysipelotrichaceae bacterium]|nr:peptide chain release factor 1 [Erysipelotrichaceae bacterium]
MEALFTRCQKILGRFNELDELLMSPAILSNPKEMGKLAKEQSQLRQVVESFDKLVQATGHLKQAQQMLDHDEDDEMVAMAEMEIEELEPQIADLVSKLEVMLIPRDPHDDKNAIFEIRGAAGGDEGNIFAGDLFRMYSRYAESRGWKVEIYEAIEATAGGYTLISFIVKGDEVYRFMKFESGAHRVQRVPKTETQGRIHTSTATVLVLPETEVEEVDINPADLTFETHRASGAGGQHVNKTDSAVRITHIPTGISVNCQDGRSQHDNRDRALKVIYARVFDEYQRRADEEKGIERRSKIGKGDRSEKIRTYNYPQNRVTDHRIGLTLQKLDWIVEGRMEEIVDALIAEEQRSKLAGE